MGTYVINILCSFFFTQLLFVKWSDEKGPKFDKMKFLFSMFLSVTAKMYFSCNESRCTIHKCEKCEASIENQEEIVPTAGEK